MSPGLGRQHGQRLVQFAGSGRCREQRPDDREAQPRPPISLAVDRPRNSTSLPLRRHTRRRSWDRRLQSRPTVEAIGILCGYVGEPRITWSACACSRARSIAAPASVDPTSTRSSKRSSRLCGSPLDHDWRHEPFAHRLPERGARENPPATTCASASTCAPGCSADRTALGLTHCPAVRPTSTPPPDTPGGRQSAPTATSSAHRIVRR